MSEQSERSRVKPETVGQAGQRGPMNTGGIGGFIRANLLVWSVVVILAIVFIAAIIFAAVAN